MHSYTFSLGKQDGTKFLLTSSGWDLTQAIRDGREQLREQLDGNSQLRVELDWGLQGALKIDLDEICQANLVRVIEDTLPPFDFEVTHLKKAA